MAQSAITVTTPSPTPPTNFSSTGVTGPNPPNFTRGQTFQGYQAAAPTAPPYFDDGSAGALITFAANTAALTGGVSSSDTGTGLTVSTVTAGAGGCGVNSVAGTYPGVTSGLVPAATSVAHEGAGTETSFTQTYSSAIYAPIPLVAVGCGPALPAPAVTSGPINPNANHATGVNAALVPTVTTASGASNVSGAGTTLLTVTGTNYNPYSKVYVDGLLQNSNYVSATSLTVAQAPKRLTAGTRTVMVTNGFNGPASTAVNNWTFT